MQTAILSLQKKYKINTLYDLAAEELGSRSKEHLHL